MCSVSVKTCKMLHIISALNHVRSNPGVQKSDRPIPNLTMKVLLGSPGPIDTHAFCKSIILVNFNCTIKANNISY